MADEADTTVTETTTETTADAVVADAPADTSGGSAADDTLLGAGAKGGDPADDPKGDEKQDEPAVPEKYELTAPEGFNLDPATVAEAEPVFKEMGLTNEQAQKLMPAAAKFAEKIAAGHQTAFEQTIIEQRKAWATEARADAEIGGPNWQRSLADASKALDSFGAPAGSPFRKLLDESGLGNHPEAIRMFAKIGAAVGEDTTFTQPATAVTPQNAARVLYPNDKPKGA